MKTGRGWWALAGFGVLTLLGLYVGAYYATVERWEEAVFDSSDPDGIGKIVSYPEYPAKWMEPLFSPINQIDRRLRPQVWSLP